MRAWRRSMHPWRIEAASCGAVGTDVFRISPLRFSVEVIRVPFTRTLYYRALRRLPAFNLFHS